MINSQASGHVILFSVLLFNCAAVVGQSFEPIEGGFDIENAVAIPPPPTVATATTNSAELGPAVTNVSADTNPLPKMETAELVEPNSDSTVSMGSMAPLEGFSPLDVSQAVSAKQSVSSFSGESDESLQVRQLEMQEQQLKRIEKVEEGLNKLVKKQSFSKSIMGTILSAATTADPVLAALGGIAGFLIGKAEDYKQSEKKNYDIQQDIIRKSSGTYTDEELKLAAYADMDLDPALLDARQIKTYANYVVEAKTRRKFGSSFGPELPGSTGHLGFMVANRNGSFSGQYTMASHGSTSQQMPDINYADVCYSHLKAASGGSTSNAGMTNANLTTRMGDARSLPPNHRRNLARYCFYSLR